MKKIFLLSASLCLCALVVQTKAQPPKGNAVNETGAWVCINGYDSENILYEPFGPGKPYPVIAEVGGKTTKPNEKLKEKLLVLRKLFMDAYPKPQGYSALYSLSKLTKQEDENAKPNQIYFVVNGFGLKYDGKGGYQKINLMALDKGDLKYAGGIKVTINAIKPDNVTGLFKKADLVSKFLEKDKVKGINAIYLLPPPNNFEEDAKKVNIKKENIPDGKFGNAADKYFVNRNIYFHKKDEQNIVEAYQNTVIITNNGKLPYEPLNRDEFLAILEAYTKKRKQIAVDYFEQDKAKRNLSDNEITNFSERLKKFDVEINTVLKLREIYKNSLDKSATVKPEDINILDGYLDRYTTGRIGNIGNAVGVFPEKLTNIFIDDKTKGYTACKEVPFYTGSNPEVFQSIVVSWKVRLPAKHTPAYSTCPENDKRSIWYALQNNFDWDKLASLLTK
jgi:hypothetical protein